MKEAYPLAWPENWIRTRIQDREKRGAWKRTLLQYKSDLEKELNRMNARSVVITTNVRPETFGARSPEPRDPGVAVYFSRPPAEDDFSWQEVLGINSPDPTLDEIDKAFIRLSKLHHPDRGGDLEMYKAINDARARAKAWVTGDYGREHEQVIACDKYTEVRLNLAALRVAIAALRRIDECGASGIMERAFKGFSALTEGMEESRGATAARV
jgi:hypothetical protein